MKKLNKLNHAVDELFKLRKQIAKLDKDKKILTNTILSEIKRKNLDEFETDDYLVKIPKEPRRKVDPRKYFESVGIDTLLNSCKINVDEALKHIGENELDKISTKKDSRTIRIILKSNEDGLNTMEV